MSIALEILRSLWNTPLNYKGVRVNFFGMPWNKKYQTKSIYNTCWYLNKKGLIQNSNDYWSITDSGKLYFKKKTEFPHFTSTFTEKSPKRLLLMFDIPESDKREREWLRWHLKKFKYTMIQKSVWVGPEPLPKDFISYSKEAGIWDFIKTFKLAKSYVIRK